MQSDNTIVLYNRLSDVSKKVGKAVTANDFTELKELFANHNQLMTEIKQAEQLNNEELRAAIQNAEKEVKNTINYIKEKQAEIIKQLSASNNKQLLNKAYNV